VGVGVWAARRPATTQEDPLANATFTRFTDWEGTEVGAEISPDGKFVAFVADKAGQFDIWLSQLGSENFRDLTKDTAALQPTFSTFRKIGFSGDGSEIWFSRDTGPSMAQMIMPLMGGAPRAAADASAFYLDYLLLETSRVVLMVMSLYYTIVNRSIGQGELMSRKLRIQHPGAIYHVMSRGDRRENIFLDDVDRHDFLEALAEACQKTSWQVHAYCLMANHYHLVLETPNPNLVAGMAWLQSTCTIRLNHRHKLIGHLLSGRYKAQLVEGSGNGYLRTACDYVHLNPVRAHLLRPQERLLAYPWSSFAYYLAAPEHTDRSGCGWTGCWASTACSKTPRQPVRSSRCGWKRVGSSRVMNRDSTPFAAGGTWGASISKTSSLSK
jgi:REP element-mobilizing transposase RayT